MASKVFRRVRNVFLILLALVVVGVGALVLVVKAKADRTFDVAPTGITASTDPEVIARGEYLFHGPMHCTACHFHGPDSLYFEGSPGDRLSPAGGQEWKMGPIGTLRAPNITSDPQTGIGGRSDEDIARVIKHGVREDGRMSPFMAIACANADDEDVRALLSYIRTLPPVVHAVAPSELGLLGQALVALGAFRPRTGDKPRAVPPGEAPSVDRGRYLAEGPAMCATCHSPIDVMDGMKLKGAPFSGCHQPDPAKGSPDKEICAPNITTHPEAGRLAGWNEEVFVARLKQGRGPKESVMPWLNYSSMTEDDLRSIFLYLQTVPPADRQTGPSVRPKGWKPGASQG